MGEARASAVVLGAGGEEAKEAAAAGAARHAALSLQQGDRIHPISSHQGE